MSSDGDDWFAVRCVFATARSSGRATPVYEERITVWRASSAEVAIARAEAEAAEYAGSIDSYLGIAQSYRLKEPPTDGAEVFSLMRESALEPEEYLDGFFDTGGERQRSID